MGKLGWYWHRLRAMSPGEVALHLRKKLRQQADARRNSWPQVPLESLDVFPKLPPPQEAPDVLRQALRRDADDILAGRWKAFGHLELHVDAPPKWHKDYLVGKDLATDAPAFELNHRELPGGADIKLIWELSRWQHLTRLAMAAYVLNDVHTATKCVEWLEDWVKHNPPYRGWNWTSALEVGMRLIQFTWIDALLKAEIERRKTEMGGRWRALCRQILPPHVWYAWRHKSFDSSANNHLLGELAGLIAATVRWPELAKLGAPLDELQRRFEHEVLVQFAEDGGNREQALNYQLFSWELCRHAHTALLAAGRQTTNRQYSVDPDHQRLLRAGLDAVGHPAPSVVQDRLVHAARFFSEVQVRREPWDYGDSDSAYVFPGFLSDTTAAREWLAWFERADPERALNFWLGEAPRFAPPLTSGPSEHAMIAGEWWIYSESGIATSESGFWRLRWDLSPLGYLKTAAHGHLDALHLSIWRRGVALVIDPGTGAYYGDLRLRNWLASRNAHNTPCPGGDEFPKRTGPFLWAEHHARPKWNHAVGEERALQGELPLPKGTLRRVVKFLSGADCWEVTDEFAAEDSSAAAFTVRWQFAPGAVIKLRSERRFVLSRDQVEIEVQISDGWEEVHLVETSADREKFEPEHPLAGIVSPAFRKTEWAPFLKLVARPQAGRACVFRTTFLASPRS